MRAIASALVRHVGLGVVGQPSAFDARLYFEQIERNLP
jgi:hypothetical protein